MLKHLKTTALLVLAAFIFPLFSSVEFITENIGGKAANLLLIPYGDFFSQTVEDELVINNYLSWTIIADKDEVVHQQEIEIKLNVNLGLLQAFPPLNYNYELYPVRFSAPLKPGKYTIAIHLNSPTTGQRRRYRESFTFPSVSRRAGHSVLTATVGSFLFTVRDPAYLLYPYDDLSVWQTLDFEPDTTLVLLSHSGKDSYLSTDSLHTISDQLSSAALLNLRIENRFGDTVYSSQPLYPSISFFFSRRFTPAQQLAQLRNILNQNEYQQLLAVDDDKLSAAIERYWSEVNPDTYSVDNYYRRIFYNRVMYADRNFGVTGYLEGWQTDRGKIYIRYGEADSITTDAFPIGAKPSIIWHYYSINRSFTFYDLRGYGNYELREKWTD